MRKAITLNQEDRYLRRAGQLLDQRQWDWEQRYLESLSFLARSKYLRRYQFLHDDLV